MTETTGRYPLSGVRVVALEQVVAAPMCTRHLADLGADVIKLERPGGGDLSRHYDSVVQGQSAYFVWLNRGKRSVELDLKSELGKKTLARLLSTADVFIHNLAPGVVDRIGFSRTILEAGWPRLITCAISGYGADGPYSERKAFDLLLQGEAGVISVTGTEDQPAKAGISIADICAAMYALSSILVSLYDRERTGKGTFIEISMFECLTEWMMAPMYHQLYSGHAPAREGMRHNMISPYGPFRAGDGSLVNIAIHSDEPWTRFCEKILGQVDLARDPRFSSNERRVANRQELEPMIEERLSAMSSGQIETLLAEADIPFGHVNTLADLAEHPQLLARGRWLEVQSQSGPIKALAHPFNLRDMPQKRAGVPGPGEHTQQVLKELEALEARNLHA
jgi:crotonobetainyl-CoA:carnitine CoA-transferase CaiB-like acyl-CoA transferase